MSSFGKNINVSIFGESHGDLVGVTVSGLPAGLPIDLDIIDLELKKRSAQGNESSRREPNEYSIVSGVIDNFTTGKPLTIFVPNVDVKDEDYDYLSFIPRPGSADLVNYLKNDIYYDFYGAGHESGRLSVPLVIFGAICKGILKKLNIESCSHILQCGSYHDESFESDTVSQACKKLDGLMIPVLKNIEEYEQVIEKVKNDNDSVGGIVECAIVGLNAVLGNSWFDSVQSYLSQVMMAIGGVKGIEFGEGFGFSNSFGSLVNDTYEFDNEDNLHFLSNYDGGISGGMTTTMPIIFRLAVKPTPSIGKPQKTVDLNKNENIDIVIKGRHDPSITRKLCSVVSNLSSIVILDEMIGEYGRRGLVESINKSSC